MHTVRNRKKLLERVRKIRGQIEGLERLLEQSEGAGDDVSLILQTVASSRGALNGLMCELIEGHIREHIQDGQEISARDREQAVEDVIEVVKRYLK
ncbi:MAG: metal/formaldehyde-sensitive transcriptional repressor [Leptospirillum sp.]|uniref:Metal/formaldehyde-sensitive transcriptional repressor n=1 Tax=Leptospirillum ferriphilum TaxID=178606 RepID=A0A7C3LY34_9BACT